MLIATVAIGAERFYFPAGWNIDSITNWKKGGSYHESWAEDSKDDVSIHTERFLEKMGYLFLEALRY